MENNLPEGWVDTPLSEVVDYKKGKKPKRTENFRFENSLPYLDIRGIEKMVDEIFVDAESSNHTNETELVVVWDGARAGWVGKSRKGALGSTLMALKPKLERDYLYRFLQTQFHYLQTNHRGTGIPHVDPDIFWNIQVPVAPLPEQHRIVAKLDTLMERIERNKQRLEKIPALLKRFRQSVLAAAVSGRLTEDWREENGVNDGWDEVELSKVIPKGGIFDGPFGSNLKTADYTDKGVRVIRLENIEHLFFVNEKETYITSAKYQTLLRHTVGEGDIIFSSFIADEIRACMLPHLPTKAVAKADCFCIRPDEKLIEKKFLLYSLVSTHSYGQLVSNIHGATRPRINTTQLKALLIPFPKLEEQREIIKRIENLFAFADKIEARYTAAKARLDKLPQSILAKAFRGELVPQNPEDEPASELLKRITAEKEKANGKLKRAVKPGRKK